ncbi:hypothetical protein GT755_23290 [Herbidospora sp. NEAU-GS84]|uniref:Uncharacterized protein n=1 Tax=Herbidospora solisilvae TaxID=2696284 RepID=A0A7C9J4M2_9ACTN|nr:hypothetical protein [Herbidospora solisilvae]NAS24602.1 hypothetical protein [Herbidospora solisilvae]
MLAAQIVTRELARAGVRGTIKVHWTSSMVWAGDEIAALATDTRLYWRLCPAAFAEAEAAGRSGYEVRRVQEAAVAAPLVVAAFLERGLPMVTGLNEKARGDDR